MRASADIPHGVRYVLTLHESYDHRHRHVSDKGVRTQEVAMSSLAHLGLRVAQEDKTHIARALQLCGFLSLSASDSKG